MHYLSKCFESDERQDMKLPGGMCPWIILCKLYILSHNVCPELQICIHGPQCLPRITNLYRWATMFAQNYKFVSMATMFAGNYKFVSMGHNVCPELQICIHGPQCLPRITNLYPWVGTWGKKDFPFSVIDYEFSIINHHNNLIIGW